MWGATEVGRKPSQVRPGGIAVFTTESVEVVGCHFLRTGNPRYTYTDLKRTQTSIYNLQNLNFGELRWLE